MSNACCRTLHSGRVALVALLIVGAGLFLRPSNEPQAADEAKPAALLALQPKEHICFIGNTLADRMQHDGWLETLIQYRFSKHDLVFRNLGFAADELTVRPRSQDFGSPEKWLTACKADVVFAFFGYNESFGGEAGLPKFKADLAAFIKSTLGAKYNGKNAPRLVLFSPIAHENVHDRNLPDGNDNNKRLELYTAAMADVAKANNVPFVDLFHSTRDAYGKAKKPLTINGVHLNEEGNRVVAEIIDKALFGASGERDAKLVAKIRDAVKDKDFHWFERYRTTDGFSVFGGRAHVRYHNGQTNLVVAQREMEVLDVMTANRDKRVWAVAQGGDLKVDDSNTPDFVPVITNKPGAGPNGAHIFLDGGDESIRRMTIAKGLKINLFASEKEFPELAKPVQMSFDSKGRLWAAVWPSYPHWKPKEEMNDKIIILEDTDGDGKADKITVFADHLHNPTGFEFWNGGVLVAQAPDIMFLKDTDGDGKADVRIRVLSGMDSADTHHTANSFVMDPGGALYWQEGVFHHTGVETPWGPPVRNFNAGVFRYEPRAQKFDVYVPFGFANPHGHVFDHWGQDIVVDGTGANPYHAALISGHLDHPQKHPHPPQVYQQRTRPCPGMEYLSSKHFPAEMQGNLLVANVIGFQGILQYKISDEGSSFAGKEVEPIVYSSDPNFRPSDIKVGPDGAIYFLDWQNPIIGHLQHNLRDPSRDRSHGRIYRVVHEGRPLVKSPKIADEPIEKLLDLLKEPEDRVRYRTRTELTGRDSDKVITATKTWLDKLDPKDAEYQHHVLEGLWLHQSHNVVNLDLLKRVLASPDFRARAAATRVLCYWRDRVPDSLGILKKLAADPHPRVRLEAVRAASFYTVPEAIEVALISADHPTDIYLDYLRTETVKALDKYVKEAIAKKVKINFSTPSGERFFLKNVSTDDLMKMDMTPGVGLELLFRPGVRDENRRKALAELAKLDKKSELTVLLDTVRKQDGEKASQDESVVFDLVRLLTSRRSDELTGARADLEKMSADGKLPVTRQLGYVALIAADNTIDKVWAQATKSPAALEDLVRAMPLIRDPGQRASLYPKVLPLLEGLPAELKKNAPQDDGKSGRFVRIELPGKNRTLTLAEVEVYSAGKNVAREGKASQINEGFGGKASKAIDGNTNGNFGNGGQSHTQENVTNPWWEVDLGKEYPITSIAVYNRTDGDFGKRLHNFTLKVLNSDRKVVFETIRNPAPAVKADFKIGAESPERTVRRAAMKALTSVRGQETETFKALERFLKDDTDRHPAVQAMQRIPVGYWPKEDAKALLDVVVGYVRKVPTKERTTTEVLDALQLGDSLASLLPVDQAKEVRRELGELGVRVLRVGTITDQMLFDKERLVVKAGKPVEIIFENTDLMPHNLVILQPGALEEIGNQAEAQATQPGALERHYVPQSNKVLLSSKLIPPRGSQKLSFNAPAKAGVYPYVCTYPGHWRRMYGALYVVEDLDDYLADAEGYLAKHPLPIADDLLKFVRPRKEWKFEELVSSLDELPKGRSFANGKQMFTVANCIACHKLNGVGQEIGPDLAKYDEKLKPADILKDIIEPSFRINEKYQTFIIETNAGKVVTGLIIEEKGDTVKVLENPLAKTAPVVIKKSDIADRKKSPTSIMPKGMMDKLTREEILDLLAYVIARGDQKHALFQGGHEHHKH
jgi:putative heme-binding domain-containing protein